MAVSRITKVTIGLLPGNQMERIVRYRQNKSWTFFSLHIEAGSWSRFEAFVNARAGETKNPMSEWNMELSEITGLNFVIGE